MRRTFDDSQFIFLSVGVYSFSKDRGTSHRWLESELSVHHVVVWSQLLREPPRAGFAPFEFCSLSTFVTNPLRFLESLKSLSSQPVWCLGLECRGDLVPRDIPYLGRVLPPTTPFGSFTQLKKGSHQYQVGISLKSPGTSEGLVT